MVPLAHTASLKNYLAVAQQLDLNPYHLLSRVGLSQTQLNDLKQRIPVDKAITLLEESAQMSNCDVFGLHMAEQREIADFGELSLLLSYQYTLREALQTIVRYRNLLNNSLEIYIEEIDDMRNLIPLTYIFINIDSVNSYGFSGSFCIGT